MDHHSTLADVARLEERHVAGVLKGMADEWRPFAGGVMSRGAPGAWFNRAQGAGLDGPVDASEVDRFIAFYEERGIEPRIDLCPFAHESMIAALADRRFVVRRFLTVLHRPIAMDRDDVIDHPAPPGLTIEPIDPSDAGAIEDFGRQWVVGFENSDSARIEETMRSARRVVEREDSIAVRAMVDGRCVGAGGLELDGELASLFGVCVAPDMRRKGIQLALLAWRLRRAREAGARVATIESRAGIATETNAMRKGFSVAYTKVTMVRPGEGLVPVAGG